MIDDLIYALYSFLAFAEVAVLIASAAGFFGFIAWQVVGKIQGVLDATVNAEAPEPKPQIKTLHPLGATVGKRARPIPGGHNERF
jgi:hypothetical protein